MGTRPIFPFKVAGGAGAVAEFKAPLVDAVVAVLLEMGLLELEVGLFAAVIIISSVAVEDDEVEKDRAERLPIDSPLARRMTSPAPFPFPLACRSPLSLLTMTGEINALDPIPGLTGVDGPVDGPEDDADEEDEGELEDADNKPPDPPPDPAAATTADAERGRCKDPSLPFETNLVKELGMVFARRRV
jgi:hypothetical protein